MQTSTYVVKGAPGGPWGGSGEENKLRREGGKPTPEDGGSDSSHVECLLFQMVDYHETEGAQGGQEEQARSSQEEAANSGPEAKVAKTSEAPRLVT